MNEVTELVNRYQTGESVQSLSRAYGIHRATVTLHLERRGVPRRGAARKLTDQDVQQAAKFYEAGDSLVTVGKRFGVDGATVWREFHGAGVVM